MFNHQLISGFLTIAASLGLVVEDTPVGIRSGQAAGCTTLGVITTHSREQMGLCHPDYLVNDLSRSVGALHSLSLSVSEMFRSVSMEIIDGRVEVTINVD